eukprot:CAMPEP_0113948310 /NCGR_PEP_ID=MMETSP1339-20121228/69712_1 /TAXON_ID=94617 /ORGANISM="Fibrocapsa japonica" /LENGTH=217 /DNA_ID=CAMNT_0000955323 /DNA_START=371 /DNA_END=1021 /DNA_ORIENTATION=+ /assembly_acc=CAM_ASM_000762
MHCGARNWNILGDQDTGYVLSAGNQQYCVLRNSTWNIPEVVEQQGGMETSLSPEDESQDTAHLVLCDEGYTAFSLQFVDKEELKLMGGDGAKVVAAALAGSLQNVTALVAGDDAVVEADAAYDWDGLRPLAAAARGGHLDIVEFLVGQGVDLMASDKDSTTALMEAANNGHLEVVRFILDRGADVDQASSKTEVTALWLAAGEGHTEVVHYLLENGA